MHAKRLGARLPLLCVMATFGCGVIGARNLRTRGVDTRRVDPIEADARLSCDAKPCSSFVFERAYSDRPSRLAYVGGMLLEAAALAGGVYVYQTSPYELDGYGNSTGHRQDPATLAGVLATVAGVLLFGDLMGAGFAFERGTVGPWELASRTTVDWRGLSVPLSGGDIDPGAENVSVRALFAKKGLALPELAASRGVASKQVSLKPGSLIAVLDPRNYAQRVRPDTARYFAEIVRSEAVALVPRLRLISRENLLVLVQASGKELADCEGECEVDTARRVGADAVVTGDLHELDGTLKLNLRLHLAASGELLASTTASGRSLDELDADIRRSVPMLLAAIR